MPDQPALGKRIKRVRVGKRLTLKAIEARASISATHISEIERGKTSPTLGALIRLARALEKSPAYFVEEEELADVSLVTAENRLSESLPNGAGVFDRLTTSIPGGSLQSRFIKLAARSGQIGVPHSHPGDEVALVLSGQVRFTVGAVTHELHEGDAIHYNAASPHRFSNASRTESASLIWFANRRSSS